MTPGDRVHYWARKFGYPARQRCGVLQSFTAEGTTARVKLYDGSYPDTVVIETKRLKPGWPDWAVGDTRTGEQS